MAIKPKAGANAGAKRVRRAIKEYMQKNNGIYIYVDKPLFFLRLTVALVWRFSLTSRLPETETVSCRVLLLLRARMDMD